MRLRLRLGLGCLWSLIPENGGRGHVFGQQGLLGDGLLALVDNHAGSPLRIAIVVRIIGGNPVDLVQRFGWQLAGGDVLPGGLHQGLATSGRSSGTAGQR